ncbi:hypothetical protein M2139_000216 [Enterococcus sp. PF1-24]|uniref:hypothetical protein n=1 Tax=unclassified Enterococcus TaxID=2608891 RepID=UPI002473A565|nr:MULTISPECIES: hypothetical protein [unclassified Enterococcus]MDH6363364.1 hypothetical protein [Enterococcus sp. PFB1-1]MDH6400335.1 hypothetical protein [Enterococcus sp. PF1-24]
MKNKLILIAGILTLTFYPTVSFAESNNFEVPMSITPENNITIYQYKSINGKMHKRLWSVSYNRWVDSSWTLV